MKALVYVGLVLSIALVIGAAFLGSENPDGLQRVLEDFPGSIDPAELTEAPNRWRDILLGAAGVVVVFTGVMAWGAFRRRGEG